MARTPFSGDGSVLDTLVVKIDVDLSGFRRGIAEAIAGIQSLRGAIAGQVGGVTLGDAMTAALVAPMVVATARIGQMRNELRLLTSEMRAVALLGPPGGPSGGTRSMGAIVPYAAGAAVLDATYRQGRNPRGQFTPNSWRVSESAELRDAANGVFFMPPIGGDDGRRDARQRYQDRYGYSPEAADRYRRRYGVEPPNRQRLPGPFDGLYPIFGGMFAREGRRTGEAFSRGRANFPNYGDAVDNLGGGAHSVGNAGRRVAGSRIASMMGLVGLGALFGDLLKLAASLATVLSGTLAGAFAALATPLGAVVGLVTALAALFVASNWESFKEFGEWFAERWTKIVAGEGMGDIIAGWNNLKDAVNELWGVIKSAFHDDTDSIVNVLQFFGEVVVRVVNAVMELLGGLMNVFAEIVRAVAALIRGDWADAWNHLGTAVQQAFRTLVNVIGSLFPEVQQAVDAIATWVEHRFNAMANTVGGFFNRLRGAGAGDSSGMTWTKGGGVANDNFKSGGIGGGAGFNVGKLPQSGLKPGMRGGGMISGDGGLGRYQGGLRRSGGALAADEEQLYRMTYLADSFGYAIAGAFEGAMVSGARFSDILKGLVQDLSSMVLRMTVIEPMAQQISGFFRGAFTSNTFMGTGSGSTAGSGGGGGGSGFWGSVLSAVGAMFGGYFADGGYLAPGKWGIVGERGPEVVYGGKTGMSVYANDNGGGGFSYVDRRSFDLRGASTEAVQRLERALVADRQELPAKIRFEMANSRARGRF